MPITCIDEFVVDTRYLAERKGVLVNTLGYYWSTETEVVELFDSWSFQMMKLAARM